MTHPKMDSATYLFRLQRVISLLDSQQMDDAVQIIKSAWTQGKQIITLGNGGSALTALHYITDWNKSVYLDSGRPFRGRALVDNLGLLTAYANDISYADIFIEQLKNILTPGDLVVAISGSGNSENVCRAVEYANSHEGTTLGICGFTGGRLKTLARHIVWAPVDDMQLAEDVHCIFGHIVMRTLCACS